MNDTASILIGVAIWLGGALALYLILKCVFNGRKGGSKSEKTCFYLCTKGDCPQSTNRHACSSFLCFPLNFQFTHVYQLFFSLAVFFIIIWGTYYIFGTNAVNSLLAGFMIGGGLALQPLMKTVVSGFVADGVNLMGKEIELKLSNGSTITATVARIGMLHTWVQESDTGELIMVHNDLLNKQPLVIKNKLTPSDIANTFYENIKSRQKSDTYIFK